MQVCKRRDAHAANSCGIKGGVPFSISTCHVGAAIITAAVIAPQRERMLLQQYLELRQHVESVVSIILLVYMYYFVQSMYIC